MKGGHNRKTDARHVLEGTFDTSRHGQVDEKVSFEAGMPEPPSALSDLAKAEWFRVCAILKAAGLLTPAYRAVIAGYCACWAEFERSPSEFKDHTQLRMYIDALGLSPVATSRVIVGKKKAPAGKYADV